MREEGIMKITETVLLMKALADRSRLIIVNALLQKPHYVEELSERLDLSASTISFHLKKLEEAGLVKAEKEQYYTTYSLNEAPLGTTLRDTIAIENAELKDQEERIELYRRKVLRSFFKHGKLDKIPVQRKKKRIILEEIALRFEAGRIYSEKEINLAIAEFHDDFCTIRRDMISEKLMNRRKGKYWLTGVE